MSDKELSLEEIHMAKVHRLVMEGLKKAGKFEPAGRYNLARVFAWIDRRSRLV